MGGLLHASTFAGGLVKPDGHERGGGVRGIVGRSAGMTRKPGPALIGRPKRGMRSSGGAERADDGRALLADAGLDALLPGSSVVCLLDGLASCAVARFMKRANSTSATELESSSSKEHHKSLI